MKNIFLLPLLLLLFSCQPKELPTILEQSEGYALMKVSHQTTKAELSSMVIKLAKQLLNKVSTCDHFTQI